jgi:hypothetical protein
MKLIESGVECGDGEVWYEIVDRLLPSERRAAFIPDEADLNAIRLEAASGKRRKC